MIARLKPKSWSRAAALALVGAASMTLDALAQTPVPSFHCAADRRCPEILIKGDPHARLGGAPSPFRGYGDPSIEYDPDTKTLWLAYSWLNVLLTPKAGRPHVDFGVGTHLAKSVDGGRSFIYVKSINRPTRRRGGWVQHEVPSLVRERPGRWRFVWLDYFDPLGGGPRGRSGYLLATQTASQPNQLGGSARNWVRGLAKPFAAARYDLSRLAPGRRCAVLTEPALFTHRGRNYLAAHCIVTAGRRRLPNQDAILLYRHDGSGFKYVGVLLDRRDARALGADVLTQPDLAIARNGDIILIATPKRLRADPNHRGCVIYTVADLARAQLRRRADGTAVQRTRITAVGNGLGPGLCTYHAASETGVLLVTTTIRRTGRRPDILFSLRRTGVHP